MSTRYLKRYAWVAFMKFDFISQQLKMQSPVSRPLPTDEDHTTVVGLRDSVHGAVSAEGRLFLLDCGLYQVINL